MLRRGFTYVELLVVSGIMAVMIGLGISSVNRLQTQTSASSYLQQIVADMRSTQLAAMNGATGASATAAGVYFENNRYTLFYGTSYSPGNSQNFIVTLDSPWELSTTISNNTLVFEPGSGLITSIVSGQRAVSITRSDTGESATIYLNRYGVFQN